MKLVNRVSLFFLSALAVVLVAYSGIFYMIVRARLVQQFEQELQGALHSLVAAVEVEPEEVKWQPLEHTIALGATQGPDDVRWVVIGDRDRVVEMSHNAASGLVDLAEAIAAKGASDSAGTKDGIRGDWRVFHRRLVAPAPVHAERELDEFDELVVVVARSVTPLDAKLQHLLWLICGLSLGAWLASALAGRWFCRRALQPVLDMAKEARSMSGADFHSRLPVTEIRDELDELAVAFNTLLDRQHRAFEQQRRFTGDAAHELRTPLTVLLGQIDVALRRPRSADDYTATLRLLRDQSAQLQKIVESLLFLARAEEDATMPDSETFTLAAWMQDYMVRWKEHPRRDDITLQIGPVGDCQIKVSPVLLARLLDNLIENAMKYSAPGSSVEVSIARDDDAVLVAVQDQGRGISAEDQAEIFNPFFRSHTARDAGIAGTGLGLAIAARIAAVSGGRLECTSEVGRGSRFTIRLPVVSCSFPALETVLST